jgi:hypothetical protein
MITPIRVEWAGHVSYMTDETNTTSWQENLKERGDYDDLWEDGWILKCIGECKLASCDLTQDRNLLRALVNTTINLPFYSRRKSGGLPPKLLVTCPSEGLARAHWLLPSTNSALPALQIFHDCFISYTHHPRSFLCFLLQLSLLVLFPRHLTNDFSPFQILSVENGILQGPTKAPILLLLSALSVSLHRQRSFFRLLSHISFRA